MHRLALYGPVPLTQFHETKKNKDAQIGISAQSEKCIYTKELQFTNKYVYIPQKRKF